MYILLALIGACALGIGAHYLIGGRDLRGVAVTPGIATAVAAVVYTGLQWAGIGEGDVLLWLASVLGSVVVAVAATLALVAARRRSDAAAKAALGI
ncbi:hypothetical protein [Microbacterium sp. 179-I 3D3 NHS]|uniref:hypothetical protein n=1 Tax=unclassified Microbacterium TaxID=2609290 RepID=UPI0039A31FAF